MFYKIEKFFNKVLLIFNFNFIPKVKIVMSIGIKISFVLTLFSTLLMAIYISSNHSYILYTLGITLFKAFTMFAVMFLIDGITFNTILKNRIYKEIT